MSEMQIHSLGAHDRLANQAQMQMHGEQREERDLHKVQKGWIRVGERGLSRALGNHEATYDRKRRDQEIVNRQPEAAKARAVAKAKAKAKAN